MIVLQVDNDNVFAVKSKRDTPVSRQGHGPLALPVTVEWAQEHAGSLRVNPVLAEPKRATSKITLKLQGIPPGGSNLWGKT